MAALSPSHLVYLLKFDPLLHVNTSLDKYANQVLVAQAVTDPQM